MKSPGLENRMHNDLIFVKIRFHIGIKKTKKVIKN